jgi:kelch-like protein 18
MSGKLYVAGGVDVAGIQYPFLDIFDPATNMWSFGAPMNVPRSHATSAVYNKKLYVIGGWPSGSLNPGAVEVYVP